MTRYHSVSLNIQNTYHVLALYFQISCSRKVKREQATRVC